MSIKIVADQCIGCGTCAAVAAATFKMDENTGKAVVLEGEVDEADTVKMAADSCPTTAIIIAQ